MTPRERWELVERARVASLQSLVFGFALGFLVGWLYWGGLR